MTETKQYSQEEKAAASRTIKTNMQYVKYNDGVDSYVVETSGAKTNAKKIFDDLSVAFDTLGSEKFESLGEHGGVFHNTKDLELAGINSRSFEIFRSGVC
jgi:hypothetical protein